MKSPNKKSPNRKSPNRKSPNRKSPNRKSYRKISPKKSHNRKSPKCKKSQKCKKISKMVDSAQSSDKKYKSAQSSDKKIYKSAQSSDKKIYKSAQSFDKEEKLYDIESTKSFIKLKKEWLDCDFWTYGKFFERYFNKLKKEWLDYDFWTYTHRFPTGCEIGNFFERYFNKYYNIDIIGMQQPENLKIDLISKCLKIFSENDDVYKIISFNGFINNRPETERVELTKLEEMYINSKYSKGGVKKFINIPVEDYKPPTKKDLIDFWSILDEFHIQKINNPTLNLVMHCTCGFGRTGTMIMSYLMYKMYKDTPPLTEKFESLDIIIKILNLYNNNYEMYKNTPPLTENFDSTIKSLKSNLNILYDYLNQKNYIKYIRNELTKYSWHSFVEVFEDRTGSKKLLIDRLTIIIQTIRELKM